MWAHSKQLSDTSANKQGFTIVELLIVVVVIAILAAITIVSFNGIQNRARQSAAQTTVKQAATRIQAFAIDNADTYPTQAQLDSISIRNDAGTSYQYRVNNSVSPRTFCVTATTQGVSYYASSAELTPSSGACAGHAANGGTVITNMVPNPSLETTQSMAVVAGGGTVLSRDTTQGFSGTVSLKAVTDGTSVNQGTQQLTESGSYAPGIYRSAVYVKGTAGVVVYGVLRATTGAGSVDSNSPLLTLNGSWQRLVMPAMTLGATATQFSVMARTSTAVATTLLVDGAMLVAGGDTMPAYADGNTAGWAWEGTSNYSSSTGPPL